MQCVVISTEMDSSVVGYSPPVYSYNLQCTMCSGGQYNWMKYVAIAFVPLTVFLVFVLCCRFSATSPLLSQLSSSTSRQCTCSFTNNSSPGTSIALQLLAAIYGVWNLDIFRTFITHSI